MPLNQVPIVNIYFNISPILLYNAYTMYIIYLQLYIYIYIYDESSSMEINLKRIDHSSQNTNYIIPWHLIALEYIIFWLVCHPVLTNKTSLLHSKATWLHVGLLSTKHRPCDTPVIITTAITDSSTIKKLQLRKLTFKMSRNGSLRQQAVQW